MPTDDDVDAPDQDGQEPSPDTDTPENGDPPPSEDILKEKYSALRKGFDEKSKEIKDLRNTVKELEAFRKKFSDDDDEEEETDDTVTKSDLESLKFETMNANKISLAEDEYLEYKSQGISPSLALKLALLDKGIADETKLSEHLRQAEAASQPSAVDRESGTSDWTKEDEERAKRFGYSLETRKRYKDMVEGRR